jgi:hypothetical protein
MTAQKTGVYTFSRSFRSALLVSKLSPSRKTAVSYLPSIQRKYFEMLSSFIPLPLFKWNADTIGRCEIVLFSTYEGEVKSFYEK